VFDGIGRSIDERHGIRADGDHPERPVIGREAHPVHKQLPAIQRAQIGRLRIAQADYAKHLIAGRIGDRDRVGKLLCRVDPVAMADRHIRIGRRTGGLAPGGRSGNHRAHEKGDRTLGVFLVFLLTAARRTVVACSGDITVKIQPRCARQRQRSIATSFDCRLKCRPIDWFWPYLGGALT
jgi:hypothetical protein